MAEEAELGRRVSDCTASQRLSHVERDLGTKVAH